MRQPKHLTHLGTPDTGKDGSPSFYATEDGRYIVQATNSPARRLAPSWSTSPTAKTPSSSPATWPT
jgi:hypothetical protein